MRWFGVIVLVLGAMACSRRHLVSGQGTLDGGTLDGGGGQAAGGGQAGEGQAGAGGGGASGGAGGGITTTGPVCAGDRWCWINPRPALGLDGASWSFSADDAWLVGRAGSILRWSAGAWSPSDSGTAENLQAVWGADPAAAWIVGDHGTILRWDGQRWSPTASPVVADLRCISGSGRDDVWAMGADATVIHWDGSAWTAVAVPAATADALTGVWAASPISAFAVSQSGILRWDGSSWSRAPAAFSGFSAIWGANANDVWAVGLPDSWEFPSGRSAMAHWDGTSWAFAPAPGGRAGASMSHDQFASVWGTGSSDVWATSAGSLDALAHFDGRDWAWAMSGSPGAILNGRLGGGRGGAVFVTSLAEISQLERGAWQRRSSGESHNVYGIWMQSPSDGWAIVDGSISHWNGSTWSTSFVQSATLYAIQGTRSDDVWAVGYGVIVHWNGVEWASTTISDGPYITSVWGNSPGDVWATAHALSPGGKILHNDGSGWTVAMSSETSIGGVWASAANDVWIGGGEGRALHWNGNTWSTTAVPVQTLGAIAGSGPHDVWAIGNDSPTVIVHWDGAAWTRSPGSEAIGQVFSLSAAAPDNAWAVGYNGALAHWDGTTWTRSRVTYNLDLYGVFAFPNGTTWIGGIDGAILRRSPLGDWR